ncbi:MAG: hypothetical protein M1825_000549 [Sarcosagium campestre]|nr:MAG: hypothetical protein M1825_000549 [Sarcosagium campestre]
MAAPNGVTLSNPFPCNLCAVAFRTSELQRAHKRSDWHVYNAKRQQEHLPSVSSETFIEKVLIARADSAAAAAKASFERFCQACQRTYYSQNAYENHLGSQKHKAKAVQVQNSGVRDDERESMISSTFSLGDPIQSSNDAQDDEDGDAEAEFSHVVSALKKTSIQSQDVPSRRPSRPHHSAADDRLERYISRTTVSATPSTNGESAPVQSQCLFCNIVSAELRSSIAHMQRTHGMFIPEQEYLTDASGLVQRLQNKVFDDHQCISCGTIRSTASGIQTHMRDKSHCKIPFESEEEMLEIGEFYDFRSTYSDGEAETDSDDEAEVEGAAQRKPKLGRKRTAHISTAKPGSINDATATQGDEAADGWETDSSDDTVATEELGSVPKDHLHMYENLHNHPHHCHRDFRPRHAKDGWHARTHLRPHAVYYDDYELHLPSGRSVGHRSLSRYYRQNLHNFRPLDSDSESDLDVPPRRAVLPSSGHAVASQALATAAPAEERGRQVTTRADGGLGMVGVTDAKKKEVKAVEKRERRREQRERNRFEMGVSKRSNMQKHFRDPLLQ